MITLRPHHLMCTQSYEGRGYSPEFVKNMDAITKELRQTQSPKIKITFHPDILCSLCPNLTSTGCSSGDHVISFDQKVIQYFHIEEKEYDYKELIQEMRRDSTPEMVKDICGTCSWYQRNACCIDQCMNTKDYI